MESLDKYIDKVKDLAEGVSKDSKAGKEIRQGIGQLEALPEFEGSIVYKMELEAAFSYLRSLTLIIDDGRLDKDSVVEEIMKVIDKVQPAEAPLDEVTEEQQAIENVKAVVSDACTKALEELK